MIIKNISIGTDIESISRFDKYALNRNHKLLLRIFSDQELDYCFLFRYPQTHLAARFSAKEATIKALSYFSIKNISYKDIEVIKDFNNVPNLRILNNLLSKNIQFRLSLSHDKENSIAQVIAIELA